MPNEKAVFQQKYRFLLHVKLSLSNFYAKLVKTKLTVRSKTLVRENFSPQSRQNQC